MEFNKLLIELTELNSSKTEVTCAHTTIFINLRALVSLSKDPLKLYKYINKYISYFYLLISKTHKKF